MIVYPSTNSSDPKEKIITEYNICNIVNRLVDREAFVISAANTESGLAITFNISGYIFSTADIWNEEPLKTSNVKSHPIYAYITLNKGTGNDSSYWATFATLALTQKEEELPADTTYLKLWDGIRVPRDSWIKFKNNSVYIDERDLDS